MSLRCPHCDASNDDAARVCSSCGRELRVTAVGDHTITIPRVDPLQNAIGTDDDIVVSLADLDPGTGVLIVRSHPQEGTRFLLGDTTRLGRHPDSEISLDDITVSRRHAEIARRGSDFVLTDAGSLNGTYVNQKRIEAATTLRSGDDLQVGKFHLVFFVAGP